MIQACLRALLSHWWRNPLQCLAFIAGLALATGLWSGVQAINAEARASYDAAANTLGEGQYDQLVPRAGKFIGLETYLNLRRAGWIVSPILEGRVGPHRLIGIDALTAPPGFGAAGAFETGEDFQNRARFFANRETAESAAEGLEITINQSVAPGMIVGDISDVQRVLQTQALSRLIVLDDQPLERPPLAQVAPELQRIASSQTADIAQLTDSFHLNLTAFGLLSFVVGLFIVHSTIGLAFEQRRGMIRTLRCLGLPLQRILWIMALEMLVLALVGAVLGIVLGSLIAALLLPDVAATLRGLYGAQVSGTLELRAEWWLTGLALGLAGSALAFGTRIIQIARMPLLASPRPRAWGIVSTRRLRLQRGIALTLLGLAGVLAVTANGLISGFALLGVLLLGAALLFPVLANWATAQFEERSTSPFWGWFWADTRQQLPGLSLALMALLLAVSANIGVATMVSSFRLTFVGFLDQRLAPELYVQTDTRQDAEALQAFLSERALETLPLTGINTTLAGQPVRLLGIRVGATYRDNWQFLAADTDIWDRVAAGQGLILNEQFARRAGLWVGDPLDLSPQTRLPIVGVVGDYGNPNAQVTLAEDLLQSLYPESYPGQFGVRTPDPNALRDLIAKTIGIPENAMINQASLKALSLETFERTFLVTAALNVLTLGVAGFAILMSLLTLADLRLPQLAPVWALGLTRRRLGSLELIRAIALAALVFLFAIPVGLCLAWILLSIVNVAAFGWKLPMFLFPREYAALGLYTGFAALLAASWPVLRLMRTPPSTLLKVFSNER